MNIKEFAKSISGKGYGCPQFTKEEIKTAKENGFVVVYYNNHSNSRSFESAVLVGAIEDEAGMDIDDMFFINKNGVIRTPWLKEEQTNAIWVWGGIVVDDKNGNYVLYDFESNIPNHKFMIYNGRNPYCRGIVFSIDDVK